MNALSRHGDFEALAAGAALCIQFGGSFVLYVDGIADDVFDNLTDAADAMADCWNDWPEVTVREFAPSGMSTDVTAEAKKQVEGWCAARGDVAPWEVAA